MARFTFTTAIDPSGALSGARDLRRRIAGSPIELTISRKSLAQPLGRITGDVAEFTKSLQAATARVTAFGATSGGIIAVSRALSEVVGSVIEVDKQLTELNTFLGQSQSRLGAVGDSLFKIAKNTASSFGDVAEAAKEFARQGLSVEETLKRTNDALILSRISGLGAAESVNALTTAINSFNKSGLDSSDIINKLVKVDTNFAVSSADLAQALTRVGSAAQDSGVSFEELISVVTTAQQVTGRGGAIIGNALKTIFTRLKRPEVLDQLQQLGVAVKDQNGSLLNGVQVLSNYIAATKNLSQIEKARNDELLGGVYQINQLKAITSDLGKANGIYARSLQIANSATDDAIQKNEQLNKSLSATLQNLKTNFQQKGGSVGEPLIKPLVQKAAGTANLLLDTFGVDKEGADKQGKQFGESLGQSLLKGVGEALAGPGLVLVGGLFINIGKRLSTFVIEASKVLLNINSVASNTKSIEEAINNTLANQPKLLDAIARGQITREQAAAQLLKLFSQQNQQLILQKNLASSLAGSFARSGFVASQSFGIFQGRQPRKSGGYIPNYALQQEKNEAISKGAKNPIPYFAKVTIEGKDQVVAVNNQEQIIHNFAGGRDTAIIPNYMPLEKVSRTASKGYIPNFADEVKYYSSNSELRDIIRNQKPGQKFFSLKFETEKGLKEQQFDEESIIRKVSSQFGVRRDLIKGKNPPKGFSSWKEFWDARGIAPVRRAKTSGEEDAGFRSRRLDRVVEAKIGGVVYRPSPQLVARNTLTKSFNAKELKKMGMSSFTGMSSEPPSLSALSPEAAEQVLKTLPFRRRFAGGYVPNYAASRYFSPSARFAGRSSSGFGRPGETMQTPQERSSFDSVVSNAVTTALYTFLPVALSSANASEENQTNISGLLKGLAALTVVMGTVRGARTGGAKGAVTGALGSAVTGGALYYQGASIGSNVQAQIFEKSRDKAQNAFNKLTENITGLSQTISDLDNLYSDPNAKPDALIRLGKKEQELLRKLEIGNPAAATAYRIAQTPEEKQKALAESSDKAQRELSLSKSILDFSQLSTAQRDAKAVTSFFKDLAGQLNREKVNIESLNQQNFSDFLKQGGLQKTSGLFEQGDAGKQLSKSFIDFLKIQDRIAKATADQDKKILNLQAPLIAIRNEVARRQEIRSATNEARQGFLSSVEKFAGNFGDRAAIQTRGEIERYNLSKSEKETFANRLFVESQGIKTGGIKNMVDYLVTQGPGKGVESMINTMIKDYQGKDYAKEDVEILKRILAQNTTSTKKLENIEQISKIQEQYALKALSLQEKLNFAGGVKTSIDAASRIDSFRNTQRGALQFQLGSLLGSKETQVAGLTNFASNLKEKYPGLFQGKGGDAIFGNIRDQLTQARAFDIRRSLASDAMSARGIGQFGMANFLESKLRPENFSEIFKIAQLQAEQQLGMKPSMTEGFISDEERQNKLDIQAKRQENADVRSVETALAPALNAITESFVKQIEGIQAPLNEALQNTFSKGLEIGNATLIAKNLELGNLFGQGEQREGTVTTGAPTKQEIDAFRAERDARRAENRAGGFIPNFSMAGDLTDSINREKTALKDRGYTPVMAASRGYIPNFSAGGFASINVEQSSKLVNSRNPGGFAVTNSVDEPRGLASIGLAARGYIPNFARRLSKKEQEDLQAELQSEQSGTKGKTKSKSVVKEVAPKLSKALDANARAAAEAAIISGDVQELDNARAQSLQGNEKTGNKPGEQRYIENVIAITREREVAKIDSFIASTKEKMALTEDKLKSVGPKTKQAKSLRDQLKEYAQNLEELTASRTLFAKSAGPTNDLEEQIRRFNQGQKALTEVTYNPKTNQYEVTKRASDNPEYVGMTEPTDEQIKLLQKLEEASEKSARKQGRGAYNVLIDTMAASKQISEGENLTIAKQIKGLEKELKELQKTEVGEGKDFSSQEQKDKSVKALEDLIAKTRERGNLLGLFESESKKTGQFSKGANKLLSGMQLREEDASLAAKQKAIKNAELQNKANEIIFRSELPSKESAAAPSLVEKIQAVREQQALRAEESVRRLSEGKAYKPSATAQINKLISPSLAQVNQPTTVVPPIVQTPAAKPAATAPTATTPAAAPPVSAQPKPAEKNKAPIFDKLGQSSFLDSLGITKGGKSPEELRKEAELKLKQRIEMMKAMEGKIGTPNINQAKQEAKQLEQLNLFISRKNKTTGFEDFFLTKEVIASNKKQALIKTQKEALRQELLRKFLPYGIKADVAFRESGGFAEMGGAEAPFLSRKPLKQSVREAFQLIVAKGVQGGSVGEVAQAKERLKADDYLKFEKESSARKQQQENWWERYVKTKDRVERILQRKVPGYTSIDEVAKYNSENSGMARNIIDAINRESGFGSSDVEKLTGVSPARLEKLKAFDLNNLLKDRGITFKNSILNLNNAKAFQEPGGEAFLNQLRLNLEQKGRASGKPILTASSSVSPSPIRIPINGGAGGFGGGAGGGGAGGFGGGAGGFGGGAGGGGAGGFGGGAGGFGGGAGGGGAGGFGGGAGGFGGGAGGGGAGGFGGGAGGGGAGGFGGGAGGGGAGGFGGGAGGASSLANRIKASINNFFKKGAKVAMDFGGKAGSFILGAPTKLGYYSPKNIPINAEKLLELERSLRENPAFKNLSEQSKQFIVDDFLRQQGPFADEVQKISEELLNRSNLSAVSQEAIDFSNGINPSKSPLRNFIETQNYLAEQTAKGKLTPEQAAKLQERIFLKEKALSPNEYANLLKRASAYRKGNLFTRSNNEAFYQAAAEQGEGLEFKTTNDFIRERLAKEDFKNAQTRMKGFGVRFYGVHSKTGGAIRPFDPTTWEFGEGLSSFSSSRVDVNKIFEDQYRAGKISAAQRDATILKLKELLSKAEISEKAKYAETLGFKYDPLTGKLKDPFLKPEPKPQVVEGLVGEGNIKFSPSEKLERALGGKTFGKGAGIGMGIVGLGMGLLDLSRARQEKDNAKEQLMILGETGLSTIGAASFIERLQGKLGGEEIAGRIGGAAFGAAAALGSFGRFEKEYGQNKKSQAALSILSAVAGLGAAGASVLKQSKLGGNFFAALGAVNQFKTITSAPNFQPYKLAEEDKKSGILNKIAMTGLLAATGQNFQGFKDLDALQKAETIAAAAGTVVGDLFNLRLGNFGVGLTGWRIGYSIGNVLEDELGLGDKLGYSISAFSGNPFGKNRALRSYAAGYRIKKKDEFESEAEYKKYLNKELSEGLKLSEYSLGDFLNSGIGLLLSPLEYFQNKAGGFIPNFAAKKEEEKYGPPTQEEFLSEEYQAKLESRNRSSIIEGVKNNEDLNQLYTSRDKANYLIEQEKNFGVFGEKDFNGDRSLYESYVAARGEKREAQNNETEVLSNPKVREFREQAAREADLLRSTPQQEINEAFNKGVTVESLRQRRTEEFTRRFEENSPENLTIGPTGEAVKRTPETTSIGINGVDYFPQEIKEAYNRGVSVESLREMKKEEDEARSKGMSVSELRKKKAKERIGALNSRSRNNYSGYVPNFASAFLAESLAIKTNSDYAGFSNAKPEMSSIYPNIVMNSAEKEVPVERVYAAMGFPGAKPKNPSETHAILNPRQQRDLGIANQGFIPNFSNEEFAIAITEAMKNGISAAFNGFIPNFAAGQTSNVVNINDNRVQNSMQANPGVFEAVMDVLIKMHPKEMASIGPKITKVS